MGGDFWDVVGSDKGGYAPWFNGARYYSSRRASVADAYFSTHEFSGVINIKCPSKLKYGDQIVLAIGDAGWPSTYQIGDELTLPVVGAAPLFLAGGQDSSLVQLWYVNGSLFGPFATYSYDPDAPAPYSNGGLSFTLTPGGIDFVKGDRFAFSVEGGHWRWRKDAGTWSASSPIPQGAVALDSGLFVEFIPGAAPSFAAGDMFCFRALQPWAASNIQTPGPQPWKWSGAGGTMVADAGEVLTGLDMAGFAYHTLPAGATLTVEGGTSPGIYDWLETATWKVGTIAVEFSAVRSARYFRLAVGNATGAQIGWWWSGEALQQSLSANSLPRLVYRVNRGDGGLSYRGRFIGKGIGGNVEWTEAALSEADLDGIVDMVDHVKSNDDEPLIFLPQVTRPLDHSRANSSAA